MSINNITEVEFGAELPPLDADTSLENVRVFAQSVGWGGGRFESHELAKKEGLPGALVPGILGMGFFTTMIHRWCPDATVKAVDTVFRAPLIADDPCKVTAIVTDVEEDTGIVELDLTIKNSAEETRVFGTAKVALPLS